MKMPSPDQSLAGRITGLPILSMKELWSLWDKYFPRRPPHNNRAYVQSRVAYKIQEESLGTPCTVRQQLIQIGEAQSKFKRQTNEVRLAPGTVMVREFDDREHRVTVQGDATFDYEGRRFKSLSAVARHITGTQWSGPLFFGVVKAKRGSK